MSESNEELLKRLESLEKVFTENEISAGTDWQNAAAADADSLRGQIDAAGGSSEAILTPRAGAYLPYMAAPASQYFWRRQRSARTRCCMPTRAPRPGREASLPPLVSLFPWLSSCRRRTRSSL